MRHWTFAVLMAVIGCTGSAPFAMADGPDVEAFRDGGDDHFDRGRDEGQALPNATCTGVLNGFFDNVVVPVGASCTLNLATIQHDVTVSSGASLSIIGQSPPTPTIAVTIGGNLNAKGCSQVVLDGSLGGIAVRHNVDIEGYSQQSGFVGPGIMIGGDFICSNNVAACLADQGTIVGSVTVHNNSSRSASDLSGNIIGGDLSCSRNSPAPPTLAEPVMLAGRRGDSAAQHSSRTLHLLAVRQHSISLRSRTRASSMFKTSPLPVARPNIARS